MKPLRVAIDTSIFENVHYAFDGHDLGILKKHVEDGKIAGLLISDIVIEEAKSHFGEKAKVLSSKVTSLINSREYKFFASTNSVRKMGISQIDAEQVAKEKFALFNKFLRETKTTKLKSDSVKVKNILVDYFGNNPPFGGADKKHEFPDAIIIARLKEEVQRQGTIAVVSSDGDWKSALSDYPGVKFFENLGQLFDFITQQEELDKELAKKAVDFYCANSEEIDSGIEHLLRMKPYEVSGMSCDRHGVMEGFDYDSAELMNLLASSKVNNIDYIGEDEIIITLKVQATVEFECSYFDESNSTWDSEDKDYIWKSYGLNGESHEFEFYASITLKVENGEVVACAKIQPRLDKTLLFDEDTLVDRHSIDTDGFWTFRRSYACPKCGHVFSVNLLDYSQSIISDERGMGAEYEHSVDYDDECENCGAKFKINGAIYEYPIGSYNSDTVKINWKK